MRSLEMGEDAGLAPARSRGTMLSWEHGDAGEVMTQSSRQGRAYFLTQS